VFSALQSKTDSVRLDALHRLGAEGEDAYELLHGKNGDAEIIALAIIAAVCGAWR
jgi:hypothetical protein